MTDAILNPLRSPRLRGSGGPEEARGRRPDPTLARLFARFALTGLVAMIIIGVIAFVAVRRSATSGAIRQATELTRLAGRGIAEPLITPGVLRGVPADLARLDRVVRQRILRGTPIVRVKIWDERGRVVYSDAPQLIGSVFPLAADELSALRDGGVAADASDLKGPENRFDRGFKRLVEVYVGIRGPTGARLLYEDYERSSTISASSRRQWMGLLPALLGALLVLYLIQVPLAYSLARRLRARQREREELLRRAIDASDLERRRIAADLHDSAVQRLAGVSLSLAASAGGNGAAGADASMRRTIADAASETRETIRELRTLLVDIYPPTLQRSGLQRRAERSRRPVASIGSGRDCCWYPKRWSFPMTSRPCSTVSPRRRFATPGTTARPRRLRSALRPSRVRLSSPWWTTDGASRPMPAARVWRRAISGFA